MASICINRFSITLLYGIVLHHLKDNQIPKLKLDTTNSYLNIILNISIIKLVNLKYE